MRIERILLPLIATASVALPAQAAGARCHPAGSRTVAANSHVVVYEIRGTRGGMSAYGCPLPAGADMSLVQSDYGDRAFGDATFALAGPTVGWADDLLVENSEVKEYQTRVYAARYYPRGTNDHFRGWQLLARPLAGRGKRSWVGSVTVWRDGSLAWISCPRTSATRCRSIGANASVYVRPRHGHRRRVAHGRAIAPWSVRHRGDRVTWVQRGERRSAPRRP
jgi:hypothetical protein